VFYKDSDLEVTKVHFPEWQEYIEKLPVSNILLEFPSSSFLFQTWYMLSLITYSHYYRILIKYNSQYFLYNAWQFQYWFKKYNVMIPIPYLRVLLVKLDDMRIIQMHEYCYEVLLVYLHLYSLLLQYIYHSLICHTQNMKM